MDNQPRPGHVSRERLLTTGVAAIRAQTPSLGPELAAPSQALLSYDELHDARQVARAVQNSWSDHSTLNESLACLWPLERQALFDIKSKAVRDSPEPELQQEHAAQAGVKRNSSKRTFVANKIISRNKRQARIVSDETSTSDSEASSDVWMSDADQDSKDSLHTAQFSDEGELSDMDAEVASRQATSAPPQEASTEFRVLYHGPNSAQLAAARAASMPPAAPRPHLGDVLLEVVHSHDVQRSNKATGLPSEAPNKDNWLCIMRRKSADGQAVQCGYQNFWYVHACAICDASRWDVELRSRVAAILQTSHMGQTSARQVLNRLKAFSGGAAGFGFAFTVQMVQQAIDDCLAAQGHDAPNTGSYRDQKSAQSKGKSTKGRGEVDLGRPIGGQDQLAEQLMAAAGVGTAAEDMACSAEAVEASSSSGGAPRSLGQEWGSTALALHQAISALATQRSAAAASAGTKSARRILSSSRPVHASTLPSHAADDPSQPLQHSQLHLEHSHGQVAGQPGSSAIIQMQHSSVTLGDRGAAATDDDNRVADATAGHDSRAAGATADDDNRVADATAGHDSRAAGATADDDNRAAGATADDDNRAAGATADNDNRAAGAAADDDNRDANANAASCLTDTGAIDEEPPPGMLAPTQAAAARLGFHFANDLLDVVLRQQGKVVRSSKTLDRAAVWAKVKKPSDLGHTAAERSRKVFQLPLLPNHQPELATWQQSTVPSISIHYPSSSSQLPTTSHDPYPDPDRSLPEQKKRKRKAEHSAGHDSSLHPREAEGQAGLQGLSNQADKAEMNSSSECIARSGHAEATHYKPHGLKPTPVARPLAGPTVHVLLEGYDVYQSGTGYRRGSDFSSRQVRKVSQDSRHVWLEQQPFSLKRSLHKEVAAGGSKPRRRARLDTLKVALDRQHAPRPSCNIGSADHTSAFQSFPHPAMHQMPPTNPSAGPLHACRAGRSQPSSHQTAQAGVAPRDSVPEFASDATINGGQSGGSCHTDAQQESAAQSPQIGVQETAQIGFQAAAQNHIGAGSGAIASSSASAVESLEAPGDDAVLAKFKDMEGDAWKVFYLASKMGLRSDVIERAAVRLRTLQKND